MTTIVHDTMIKRIFTTPNDTTLTVIRVILGFVMLAHGSQKLLGWFGGYGFHGTMGYFTGSLGIPAPFAFLAIVAEFFGGLGLIVGLLGRVAAVGVTSTMIVATLMSHLSNGFFMNWSGSQKGEGFEYHLLAIAMGLAVLIKGSGALSFDRMLSRRVTQ